MHTTTTTAIDASAPTASLLLDLATAVDALLVDPSDAAGTHADQRRPQLVAVTTGVEFGRPVATASDRHAVDRDGVDLLLRPLSCHPALELRGFVAPDDWWAIGISSGAWASTCDPTRAGLPRPTDHDRRRVHITQLISRDGDVVNILRENDADLAIASWHGPEADRAGLLDDSMRRALGLPTAPAPVDTAELWSLLWLDRALLAATSGNLELTWPTLASLHPAFDHLAAEHDPELTDWVTEHLGRAGEHLIAATPWSRVMAQTQDGHGLVGGLSDADVAWMDLGMFARMILGSFAPLDEVLADLAAFLTSSTHQRLTDVVRFWGQLPGGFRSGRPTSEVDHA